jgi:predicted O-methyltransferase YrrM
MNFSHSAVTEVFRQYEARREHERIKAAEIGSAIYSRVDEFLLPVGPEVGWFLHSLILARRPARILELGTSYGYSTLFLADAAKQVGGTLVTMDIADYKQHHAAQMIEIAGLRSVVDFRLGNAIELIGLDAGPFDFVLLDIWKDLYIPCLEAVYPKMSEEAVLVADNMIEPAVWREDIRRYRAAIKTVGKLESVLIPIGSGIELSVKWSGDNLKR